MLCPALSLFLVSPLSLSVPLFSVLMALLPSVCLFACPLACLYLFPRSSLPSPPPINIFYTRYVAWHKYSVAHLGMGLSVGPGSHGAVRSRLGARVGSKCIQTLEISP